MLPQPEIPTSPNVNLTSINGVATVIFAGPEGLSRRLLSITGGFRADVCKQVYIGGSGENNNGVTTVIFGRPGIRNFTCSEDFSSSEALEKQISFEIDQAQQTLTANPPKTTRIRIIGTHSFFSTPPNPGDQNKFWVGGGGGVY